MCIPANLPSVSHLGKLSLTLVALVLVVTSAFMHAGWNFFAKRAGGGVIFTWLFAALTATIYASVGIFYWYWQDVTLDSPSLLFIGGSAIIHIAYFLLLQRGYRTGDLSLVYPLARGSGPVLATLGAISFLGENPSTLALTGTLLIVISVLYLRVEFALFVEARSGLRFTAWRQVCASPPILCGTATL